MPIRARSTPRSDHIAASSAEPPCPTSPDPPQTPQPPDHVCRARFPASGAETVYVVDYDQGDRDAIGQILHHRGYAVEAFADCSAFLAAFRPDTRGCLLVDGLMLGVGGIDIIEHLRDECDEFPTIVMSADASPSMVVQAMKAGAVDYIEKPIGPEELFSSIRQALEKSRDADGLSGFRKKAVDRIANLTPRQHQILKLVLAGQPSKSIAAELGIAQRTVENHRASITKKTGAQSLPLMVHTAICASCRLVDRIRH
jgi:two-component system, chemotaxis family, CheB/CheR fusion protein